ncbi:hypothetical protein [Pseudoalteromonas luteoviolacea]|uniref:hypothetical protein n=1 Tax=Pseudoalteromonas luteoviolacea TaxID=43657 RepID=UPI001B36FF20|nr:hypothetical protein [Pseudoalteromonas luteoviolacea]MBQ4836246.1 hypothetical protein [Pseudoalteromonas luteoviolacea]
MLLPFILVIVLVKSSLLGLGGISIVIAALSLLVIKLTSLGISKSHRLKFKRLFKIALWGHLSAYIALLLKALLIDGIEDIPTFIVSHLILHHALCATIAGVSVFLALRIYMDHRRTTNIPQTK